MNFEDIIWLFTSNKKTRGIIRLNIAEGALLYKYCRKKSNSVLLEIGRKYGGSTTLMASALKNGHLYSIDIIMHDCVSQYVKEFKNNITFITADTKDIKWDKPVDLVFIDGDHSYKGVQNDIIKFLPYINKNGYAIFHDIIGKKSILQPLINQLTKHNWYEVDKADSMLVIQKK